MHRVVRDDLNAGQVRDAFAHLRLVGLVEGLDHSPPVQVQVLEEYPAREAFIARRERIWRSLPRKLDFSGRRAGDHRAHGGA